MVDLVYTFRALDRSIIVVEVLTPDVATHGAITVEFCVTGWTMFCHRSIIALPGLQNSLTVRSRLAERERLSKPPLMELQLGASHPKLFSTNSPVGRT